METALILHNLRELTLDFVNGKRNRPETVEELHLRINPNDVYKLSETLPEEIFIFEVFVSLDSLTEEGFAPSPAEIKYFADCFEGKKIFSREEVRGFQVGAFEKQEFKKQSPGYKSPSSNPKI